MSPRNARTSPLFLLLLSCWATGLWAAPRWRTLETTHATVISQLPEDETRQWASGFEQFIAAATNFLLVDEQALARPTLLLFERGCLADYKPLTPDKRVRHGIAGMFAGGNLIALERGVDYYATRRILFHESTHWLLTGAATTVPLWLNEGMAEVFSTFEPGRDHGIVGLSIGPHVELLQRGEWIPWAEILRATHRDPLYRDETRTWHFYAQSWLFAHRLLFGATEEGRIALERHTRARQHGADPTRAFALAIEKDFRKVEAQLQTYLRDTQFKPRRLARPAAATITCPFTRADPLLVEKTLAILAITGRREATAASRIGRIRKLAPDSTLIPELIALKERMNRNTAAAASSAQEAIRSGSQQWFLPLLVAEAALDEQLAEIANDDAHLRLLAAPYRDAIAAGHDGDSLFEVLARVGAKLTAPTEADITLLKQGQRRYPDSAWIFVGLAAIHLRRDNAAEAGRLLGEALSRPEIRDRTIVSPGADDELAARVESGVAQIREYTKDGNLEAAIHAFEALLAIDIPND